MQGAPIFRFCVAFFCGLVDEIFSPCHTSFAVAACIICLRSLIPFVRVHGARILMSSPMGYSRNAAADSTDMLAFVHATWVDFMTRYSRGATDDILPCVRVMLARVVPHWWDVVVGRWW